MKRWQTRWAMAGAMLAGGTLIAAACGEANDNSGAPPDNTGQACDTSAACLGGNECCIAPGETVGVCQPACDCTDNSDCTEFSVGVCCNFSCEYIMQGTSCLDGGDCNDADMCVFANEEDCLGACQPPGSGGGGAGGSGGSGGGGGGMPAYTVLSGEPTMDRDGCLVSQGMGVMPAHIVLDDPMPAGLYLVVVDGQLIPIPGGIGLDGIAVIQVSTGGTVNGNSVEGAHLGRSQHNAVNDEASLAIFDTAFNEADKIPFLPVSDGTNIVLTVTSDPGAETMMLEQTGDVSATLSASSLGATSGDRISVLIQQARVCAISVMQR